MFTSDDRRRVLEKVFSRMNPPQREAVFHTEGPLLILAGAGSGKTTVLINRIADLVRFGTAYHSEQEPPQFAPAEEERLRAYASGNLPVALDDPLLDRLAVGPVNPWQILAITFTNKAAGELRDRLSGMLGERGNDVEASTFHSFCARLLRREAEALGYTRRFTIYDTDDSRRLMKLCMKELEIDEKALGHKQILSLISRAKDTLISPEEYADTNAHASDPALRLTAKAYRLYQQKLREADAMDFDDLLCRTVELFTRFPEVLEKYQRRYRYLMVDEYQDTNHAQYRLISLLAAGSGNLCVVGDDDQSIYKFRGATIENILSFETTFPHCRVIRLEQNYRSTGNILKAANGVIAHNVGRKGKTLWTAHPDGDAVQVIRVDDEDAEARLIAETVLAGIAGGRKYRDHAVLYRAHAQSNAIEKALIYSGIPYRVIGGQRFNDTQEVKDAMAYLRVIANPQDEVSLRRIVNQPTRHIGDTSLDKAAAIAAGLEIPLYEVLSAATEYPDLSRAAKSMVAFTQMMDGLRHLSEDPEVSLHALYSEMLEQTGYLAMWKNQGDAESDRVENLEELSSSIRQYEKRCGEDQTADLAGFLEEQSLVTDIDNYDADADAMVLMTMHSAKGLEFPIVLVPGVEDGVFPNQATLFEPTELEEDRRLCYVTITRARERLYLLHARHRMLYGRTESHPSSRFLEELPPEAVRETDRCTYAGDSAGFGFGGGNRSYGERGSGTRSGGYGRSGGFGSFGGSAFDEGDSGWYRESNSRPAPSFPRPTAASTFRPTVVAKPKPVGNAAFAVGDHVSSAAFGEGVITAATAMAGDTMLTIQFDKVGQKKLMANYAKLIKK